MSGAVAKADAHTSGDPIGTAQEAPSLGGDDLVMRLMYELHAHVPEEQRPMSMSDFSDEQAVRMRKAVHAVLTEWEGAKAALRSSAQPTPPIGTAQERELIVLLNALGHDCDSTNGWEDAAPTVRQAADALQSRIAEVERLIARVSELEETLRQVASRSHAALSLGERL